MSKLIQQPCKTHAWLWKRKENDFALYDVLLVQNRWLDMQVCCVNRRLKGAFAEIQHTSAYASIRHHTPAYDSII